MTNQSRANLVQTGYLAIILSYGRRVRCYLKNETHRSAAAAAFALN
jgi:hypothetical protein